MIVCFENVFLSAVLKCTQLDNVSLPKHEVYFIFNIASKEYLAVGQFTTAGKKFRRDGGDLDS